RDPSDRDVRLPLDDDREVDDERILGSITGEVIDPPAGPAERGATVGCGRTGEREWMLRVDLEREGAVISGMDLAQPATLDLGRRPARDHLALVDGDVAASVELRSVLTRQPLVQLGATG